MSERALSQVETSFIEQHTAVLHRGPSAPALARQGDAAQARISGEPMVEQGLWTLHGRLLREAKAEYGRVLQLEAQAYVSPLCRAVEAGAALREHLPALLGGVPHKDGVDHGGWQHVFALLGSAQAALSTKHDEHAMQLLGQVAAALRDQKLRTRSELQRIESGGEACIAALEVVIGLCSLAGASQVGAAVAATHALGTVCLASAGTAAAMSTGFSLAKVAGERTSGMNDDGWLSALLDGAEAGVTTLVTAFVGGKLAAKFIPRLARYLGSHVTDDFFVRLGKILHLVGPAPRDYFVHGGTKLFWDFMYGAGSVVLNEPIHLVFERFRGHKITTEAFMKGVLEEVVKGAALQTLMSGLLHVAQRTTVAGYKPSSAGEGIEPASADSARFHELLENPGIVNKRSQLEAKLVSMRADPSLGPSLTGVRDDELLALIGYTGADFDMMNQGLRMGDERLLAVMKPYIDLAKRGMSHLPAHRGRVWRGVTEMKPEALARYQLGATVEEAAFTSTSMHEGAEHRGVVKMEIESLFARKIVGASLAPIEDEALFAPGSRFLVTDRSLDEAGTTHLRMVEVTE
ncbi:MAG: ADP-ribosyltransferase domain-containing protein [Polyangia bacterium]